MKIFTRLQGVFAIVVFLAPVTAESQEMRFSQVSENGMPKNIVKKGSRWNFSSDAIVTHNGWQYAAYWDDSAQVSVARRKLPQGEWMIASLTGYKRNATENRGKGGAASRGFGDGHEKVAMGISPDGFIHLSFDQHLSELRYRVSKFPVAANPDKYDWNTELFGPVKNNLGGERIDYVTYPSFSTDGNSFVLYLRLGGGSGSANSHFFTYHDGEWLIKDEKGSKVIDKNWSGGNGTVNAYVHDLVFHEGTQHVTWSWRDTPDKKTSHSLCYAYSDNGGITWKNNAGVEIARAGETFITADSPGVTVWEIPAGGKYINGGSLAVSDDGSLHVLCRDAKGVATHFHRDPKTGKWTSKRTKTLGSLVANNDGAVFGFSDWGTWKLEDEGDALAVEFDRDVKNMFSDSKPDLDISRAAYDGWVSLIGQKGRVVTVIDLKLPK